MASNIYFQNDIYFNCSNLFQKSKAIFSDHGITWTPYDCISNVSTKVQACIYKNCYFFHHHDTKVETHMKLFHYNESNKYHRFYCSEVNCNFCIPYDLIKPQYISQLVNEIQLHSSFHIFNTKIKSIINKQNVSPHDALNIWYINSAGTRHKESYILAKIINSKQKIDIFAITESHTSEIYKFIIPEYNCFSINGIYGVNNKGIKQGISGGVSLYTHNSLDAERIDINKWCDEISGKHEFEYLKKNQL